MAKLPKLSSGQQFFVSLLILLFILFYVGVTYKWQIESQAEAVGFPSPTPITTTGNAQRIKTDTREQIRNLVRKIFYQRSRTPYRQIAPVITGLPTSIPTP